MGWSVDMDSLPLAMQEHRSAGNDNKGLETVL